MKLASTCLCLVLGSHASTVRADDLLPGLWELSMHVTVDAAPGFDPGALTQNQCFSKDDVRDPAKLLAPVTTGEAADCAFTEKTYAGNTFRFKMQCAGEAHLQSAGEVTFTPSSMSGSVTTSSTIDGSTVQFKSALSAHRVGDC